LKIIRPQGIPEKIGKRHWVGPKSLLVEPLIKNKMKYIICLFAVVLSSCQQLQVFNLWPKPSYSAMERYKAEIMFSGTKECSLERIKYVDDNPPPVNTHENKLEAISWVEAATMRN
jgi:hypothetical protein